MAPDVPNLPVLDVQSPARGAFLPGPVQVSGTVTRGTGVLSRLTVGGDAATWADDGSFDAVWTPAAGLAIFGGRLEDDLGERAVDGRAVQVGPVNPPGTLLPNALTVQLSAVLLDDDDPDIDDIAAVMEAVLSDPAFTASMTGFSLDTDAVSARVDDVSLGGVQVDITPWHGILFVDLTLTNLSVAFSATIEGQTLSGAASADEIVVQLDIDAHPDLSTGGVAIDVPSAQTYLTGFTVSADGVPAWATDALSGTVADLLSETVSSQGAAYGADLLGTALDELVFQMDLGGPAFAFHAALSDVFATPEGLVLSLDAGVEAIHPAFEVPAGAGSLKTDAPPPPMPIATPNPIVMMVDDDLLNQVLFEAWRAGVLSGIELSGVELLALSGEALPPPLGPVASVAMDLKLPPVISPGRRDLPADVGLGEFWIDLTREDGEHVAVSLNARVGTDIRVQDGAVVFALDDRPSQVEVEAGMLAWPAALDGGDLASLFRLSAPNLVGSAGGAFPPLALPSFDVGDVSRLAALNDLVLTVTGGDVAMDPSGFVRIEGAMEVAQ